MKAKQLPTIKQLDARLEPVLRRMEARGILLDVSYLQSFVGTMTDQIGELERQIYRQAGHEFDINSPRQIAGVLYDELHLNGGEDVFIRTTKTKQRSTAASQLGKLIAAHPIVPLILQYREKSKLLSTYVEPLPKLVGSDGRLHTTYRIDTAAGRLSSKNPNLQNIPVRTEEGRQIRRAFVAAPGYQLLSVDYSQIELRIAAHFSGDAAMIDAFRLGHDIHTATATKMGVDRRVAKAINFGLLFGQGVFGLSEALGISHDEAKAFIDQYFATYPTLHDWMRSLQGRAKEKGYAETLLLGRRRYLGELKGPNTALRAFAERVALNHPVQGTEAEIVSLAMIAIDKEVPESDAKLLLQVHDELVFEVPSAGISSEVAKSKRDSSEVEEARLKVTVEKIRSIMTSVVDLAVPIVAEARVGPNWAELEPVSS